MNHNTGVLMAEMYLCVLLQYHSKYTSNNGPALPFS